MRLAPRFHGAPTNRSHRHTVESDIPLILARCLEDVVDAAVLVPLVTVPVLAARWARLLAIICLMVCSATNLAMPSLMRRPARMTCGW